MKQILIFLLFFTFLNADERYFKNDTSNLNLNQTQKEQFKQALKEYKSNIKSLKNLKERYEDEMEESFKNSNFSKENFIKSYKEILDKKLTIKANFFEKIYEILTPEQREIFGDDLDDW